jgi:hypothetical protein
MIKENPPAGRAGKVSKYLLYAIGEIVLIEMINLNALSFPQPLKGRARTQSGINFYFFI